MKQRSKTVSVMVPGSDRRLACQTSPGLFSADRVDDGTRLLLAHLPATAPADVLDLGCGWGALALAVAAAFPRANVRAVDRDLLAVRVTVDNAAALGLGNVHAEGGIGTRSLAPDAFFDWALCNVPARIGHTAIAAIVAGCARRLRPGGEVRIVVIRDLVAGLRAELVAESANHAVLSIRPQAEGAAHDDGSREQGSVDPRSAQEQHESEGDLSVYIRDEVLVAGRLLARPQDLGEDPKHLTNGIPLLLDVLPRRAEGMRVAIVRGGYGAIALELAARGAQVVAVDRDLLAAAFVERNARRHGLTVAVRTAAWLPDAVDGPVDLAVVDPAEPIGAAEAVRELLAIRDRLHAKGRILCLARTKLSGALRRAIAEARVLAERAGFVVLELRATRN